jgi:hypothetical protein
MSIDPSKFCADYLRATLNPSLKIKASHARELVAAYFGYKSHAALLKDTAYPITALDEASILVPDVPLLQTRITQLNGLALTLPTPMELAKLVGDAVQVECFGGVIWRYDSLENYVMEVLLPEEDGRIMDCLSGVMAETNACFDDAYYEEASVNDHGNTVDVMVRGVYSGQTDEDRMFCGDKIDMTVEVELYRCAGRRGFSDYDISATGAVNDDWVDPELKYARGDAS